jgi:hypothetical protein
LCVRLAVKPDAIILDIVESLGIRYSKETSIFLGFHN